MSFWTMFIPHAWSGYSMYDKICGRL